MLFFVGEFLSASGEPVPRWSPGTAEGLALGQHEPPDWVWRRLTPVRPCWGLGGTMLGSHHFGSLFQMCLWPPPPLFGFGLLTANYITAGGLASHTVPKDKTNSRLLSQEGQCWAGRLLFITIPCIFLSTFLGQSRKIESLCSLCCRERQSLCPCGMHCLVEDVPTNPSTKKRSKRTAVIKGNIGSVIRQCPGKHQEHLAGHLCSEWSRKRAMWSGIFLKELGL